MENRGYSRAFLILFMVLLSLGISGVVEAKTLDVESLLLKVSMHQGEYQSKTIRLSGLESGEVFLNTNVNGVILNQNNFSINPGETKSIEAFFNSSGILPGVYVGSVEVKSGSDVTLIPIIFEIESNDVLFDLNIDIAPQYNELAPGKSLVSLVKIYDLSSGGTSNGLGATKVDVSYVVLSSDGGIINSETESIVVDKQTQVIKSVTFPNDIKEGDYIYAVEVKYKDSIGVSTYNFRIVSNSAFAGVNVESLDWKFFSVVIAMIIFFSGLGVLFIYFLKDKDRVILELERYNSEELAKQKELLEAQGKLLDEKGEVDKKKVNKEIEQKVFALKEKHKARMEVVKKLRKKGADKELEKKLLEWKKSGYDTIALEAKLGSLGVNDMKKLMADWKKKYNTEGYKNKKR
jgi:hypothetical protein